MKLLCSKDWLINCKFGCRVWVTWQSAGIYGQDSLRRGDNFWLIFFSRWWSAKNYSEDHVANKNFWLCLASSNVVLKKSERRESIDFSEISSWTDKQSWVSDISADETRTIYVDRRVLRMLQLISKFIIFCSFAEWLLLNRFVDKNFRCDQGKRIQIKKKQCFLNVRKLLAVWR